MNIVFTPLQFISITTGIGLLCFFWGTFMGRRDLTKLIAQGLKTELDNWVSRQF